MDNMFSEKIPVEGNPGFYRDSKSGAILNCSDMSFSRYLQTKEQKIKESYEMEELKIKIGEISCLKNEITELKHMMNAIIDKLNVN
jgi:hypothetical protein